MNRKGQGIEPVQRAMHHRARTKEPGEVLHGKKGAVGKKNRKCIGMGYEGRGAMNGRKSEVLGEAETVFPLREAKAASVEGEGGSCVILLLSVNYQSVSITTSPTTSPTQGQALSENGQHPRSILALRIRTAPYFSFRRFAFPVVGESVASDGTFVDRWVVCRCGNPTILSKSDTSDLRFFALLPESPPPPKVAWVFPAPPPPTLVSGDRCRRGWIGDAVLAGEGTSSKKAVDAESV